MKLLSLISVLLMAQTSYAYCDREIERCFGDSDPWSHVESVEVDGSELGHWIPQEPGYCYVNLGINSFNWLFSFEQNSESLHNYSVTGDQVAVGSQLVIRSADYRLIVSNMDIGARVRRIIGLTKYSASIVLSVYGKKNCELLEQGRAIRLSPYNSLLSYLRCDEKGAPYCSLNHWLR